jgi:cysteinyl-tRNA synthetase
MDRRSVARAAKRWEEADALRTELEILGYSIEDTSEGMTVYRRS